VAIIKIRFEATQIVGESVMTLSYWKETCENMNTILSILKEKPTFFLKEGFTVEAQSDKTEAEAKNQANIISYLELLDMFLTIGIKGEEPRSAAYVIWLKNEVKLLELAEEASSYYKRAKFVQAQTRVALVQLDRLHSKHDNLLKLMREKGNKVTGKEYYLQENMTAKINVLANLVYENGNEKQKLKAALYQIYHHALHSRFHEAKDLFVMSRMSQQHIHDIQLQILYNRAMVQLGLAAFQCGLTQSVLECLGDIVATNRLRELLGQGIFSKKDKSAKQELEEKKRLLPYHTHISVDYVEAAYLISAMLIEIPMDARLRHTVSNLTATRHFRKIMQDFERRNVMILLAKNCVDLGNCSGHGSRYCFKCCT
jgi:translation initiation factor 3 subunit C